MKPSKLVIMNITVNGYNLRQNSTGIANVIINAVNTLADIPNIKINLIVSPVISDEIKSRLSPKIQLCITGGTSSFKWLMFEMPEALKNTQTDIIWSPTPLLPFSVFRFKKPVLITIHDFVSIEFRKTMTLKGRLITRLLEKHTIKKADFIWCVSEYTKSKLEQYYPDRKSKAVFTGSAPDKNIRKINFTAGTKKAFLEKFNIKKEFLLFVGSLEPRKNLSFLLNVFKDFHKANDIQLVIVGARSWGKTDIAQIINSQGFPKEDVIFTSFISEEELMSLYSLASCYVSTSLNEGFGLPQAEAMICGCPVVTSHNSAMIEVVDGFGITVEGFKIEDWISAIENTLKDREKIIKRQDKKAKTFDWTQIGENLYKYLNDFSKKSGKKIK